jgi:hypothetical protein
MFVEEAGVFEVEVDSDNSNRTRCTCSAFKNSSRCKHSKFVRNAMATNNGHYTIQVPVDVDDDDALMAMESAEAFRDFIIKHAKVETIE